MSLRTPVRISSKAFHIPLTRGKYAIVDSADVDKVSRFTWCAQKMGDRWYAHGTVNGKTVQMHRFLMGAKSGQRVCNRDGNGLNNRRNNLFILGRKPYRVGRGVYAIPLTKGKIALVDSKDLSLVEKFHWSAHKIDRQWYAFAVVHGKHIHMHRLLLKPDSTERIDHRDWNGLNNRRKNLRVCNASQNAANMRQHRDSTSPFKGVTYNKRQHSWVAQLMVRGSRVLHSYHKTAKEAAEAYDKAARKHHGHFAKTNFPEA